MSKPLTRVLVWQVGEDEAFVVRVRESRPQVMRRWGALSDFPDPALAFLEFTDVDGDLWVFRVDSIRVMCAERVHS